MSSHHFPERDHDRRHSSSSSRKDNSYYGPDNHSKFKPPVDENLPPNTQVDPRGDAPRMTKKATHRGAGRNTESFDPASTLVRPDVRVVVGNPSLEQYNKPLKHDDVVIVPELFGPEDNWELYYELVKEVTQLQGDNIKGSEFISWHEGAHLICKSPDKSPTFQKITAKLCSYFNIDASSAGTRFNWYKDSSDWKPFHHDSAAFNPRRAQNQNITIGVSFGASRELAFVRAAPEGAPPSAQHQPAVRMYFPQPNNGVFTFGRDVNIHWKHGVNAVAPTEQDGKGRISIILWGKARNVIEEEGSPPLLGSDGQGPHANHNNNRQNHHKDHRKRNRSFQNNNQGERGTGGRGNNDNHHRRGGRDDYHHYRGGGGDDRHSYDNRGRDNHGRDQHDRGGDRGRYDTNGGGNHRGHRGHRH